MALIAATARTLPPCASVEAEQAFLTRAETATEATESPAPTSVHRTINATQNTSAFVFGAINGLTNPEKGTAVAMASKF